MTNGILTVLAKKKKRVNSDMLGDDWIWMERAISYLDDRNRGGKGTSNKRD